MAAGKEEDEMLLQPAGLDVFVDGFLRDDDPLAAWIAGNPLRRPLERQFLSTRRESTGSVPLP